MEGFFSSENLIALLTLSSLEIVLGIDNIVFISILVGKLPEDRRASARRIGLLLAMGMRIALLLAITWVMGLTQPFFSVAGHPFTGRDVILLVGGLFLVAKATWEIHDKLEGVGYGPEGAAAPRRAAYGAILVQIMLLDIVFSLDSVITAVGMARHIGVMIAAVVIAVLVMLVFAGAISAFIERHPTVKMLALSFLLLIGVVLIADGFGQHVSKGYIYFAMAFSLFVELLNLRIRAKTQPPVQLHQSYVRER
ncbi:MAG TPA: TerC family protein [Myxococcota bacterium]|nr:TerC family protein [Myxococcota bacterium]